MAHWLVGVHVTAIPKTSELVHEFSHFDALVVVFSQVFQLLSNTQPILVLIWFGPLTPPSKRRRKCPKYQS